MSCKITCITSSSGCRAVPCCPLLGVQTAATVAAYLRFMVVKRIKPNILSNDFESSRTFYTDVIGLDDGGGLDWILFFGTDKREVQLSVMALDLRAHQHPAVSIEVDDVDQVYARAVAAGAEITYPLTHEDWGLRRFFLRDPNGAVINVTQHDE